MGPTVPSGALGMKEGDRIVYEPTGETGIAGEFLQDGDVSVTWDRPTNTPCMVKWNHCHKANDLEIKMNNTIPIYDSEVREALCIIEHLRDRVVLLDQEEKALKVARAIVEKVAVQNIERFRK